MLCLFALVRHRSEVRRSVPVAGDRYLILFFLALSLGITHHPSIVFPGLCFVLYLGLVDPSLLRQPGRWLKPLIALLPGLLVLLYLPVRGAPRLATPSGFLNHILARGFRGDMFALGLIDRLVLFPTLMRFQFNAPLLVGMCLGALLLLWDDRRLALLLLGSFLVHTLVTLTYDAPQTVEYEMPAYISLALLTAVPFKYVSHPQFRISNLGSPEEGLPNPSPGETTGPRTGLRAPFFSRPNLGSVEEGLPNPSSGEVTSPDAGLTATSLRAAGPAVLVILRVLGMALLVAALANLLAHLPSYRSLSRSHDTRDYARTLLEEAPEEAIVLSNWHWFTPLRYVQRIEGVRPDVIVEYVAPRGEPLSQTWVRSIEEHIAERPVIAVRFFEQAYSQLPYAFDPLGEAFLVRPEPRVAVPANLVPVDAVLGEQIEVLGYRLAAETGHPAEPLVLTLAWSPVQTPTVELALFAQLIGSDGKLWSAAEDPRHLPGELSVGQVVIERFIIYPRLHAAPGAYELVMGAYSTHGRLKTSDGSDVVALKSVRLQPSKVRPVTQHPRLVRLAGGPTLIGVDYDLGVEGMVRTYLHWAGPGEAAHLWLMGEDAVVSNPCRVPPLNRDEYVTVSVDRSGVPSRLVARGDQGDRPWDVRFDGSIHLPSPHPRERYVPFGDAMILISAGGPTDDLEPGTEATLALRFRAQRPLQRDYIVSTSLTGLNADGTWAWRSAHDTVPALGAIPTLKWIRGSLVLDPHRMDVPEDTSAVPVVGSLLVYDHFTQRSLPNLDERLESVVEIGTWRIR
jgi:hypothetical protein